MNKQFKQREEFNKAFEISSNESFDNITQNESTLEYYMLKEELNEYKQAAVLKNKIEVLDAIADIGYLWFGMIKKHGLKQKHIELLLDEVHRSNMTKLHDGKVVKNAAGKVVKPETYSPPDIKRILHIIEQDELIDKTGL